MLKSLNHIGIAVKDLDASIEVFKKIFGFENVHKETVLERGVHVASFKVGDVSIELTAPTDENSPIYKFLEKNGEGIQHLAFESDAIQDDLTRLKNDGVRLINETPVDGAHDMKVAFMHPKSTNRVLMEVCQPKKDKDCGCCCK